MKPPRELHADNVVDTNNFFSLMCHPRFVRLSMHYGRVDSTVIFCMRPPELVPGYLQERLNYVRSLVADAPRPPWWRRMLDAIQPHGSFQT